MSGRLSSNAKTRTWSEYHGARERGEGWWGLLIHLDPGPLRVTCLHVTQSVNCYAFQRYPMLKKITNDGSFKSVSVF